MKKPLILLVLALLLGGGIGHSQEAPALTDNPAVQTKRASKFQGLWQQRKGHNLRLEYGFQADLLGNSWVDTYLPLRFDLEYQYDIPWNPKRINFYAYAGFVYKQLNIDYRPNTRPYTYTEFRLDGDVGLGAYLGIGFKIHCTDWLHLSFAQAFNVMDKVAFVTHRDDYFGKDNLRENAFGDVLIGSQTSIRIVGQIKQWSVYLGYRVDHWQKTVVDFAPFLPNRGIYENYLTFGIGYDF